MSWLRPAELIERLLLLWLVLLSLVAMYWQRWLPGVPDRWLSGRSCHAKKCRRSSAAGRRCWAERPSNT